MREKDKIKKIEIREAGGWGGQEKRFRCTSPLDAQHPLSRQWRFSLRTQSLMAKSKSHIEAPIMSAASMKTLKVLMVLSLMVVATHVARSTDTAPLPVGGKGVEGCVGGGVK